jgi:hypothetical protein
VDQPDQENEAPGPAGTNQPFPGESRHLPHHIPTRESRVWSQKVQRIPQ